MSVLLNVSYCVRVESVINLNMDVEFLFQRMILKGNVLVGATALPERKLHAIIMQ